MKTLEQTFTNAGFEYSQVKRIGDIAIYKQTRIGQPGNVHYEVGIVQKNKAREMFGKTIEASESWPPSSQWGILDFTYANLSDANRRMVSLGGLIA